MASSSSSSIPLSDTDLDDAELWAVIDSAAATRSSKKHALKHANTLNFTPAPRPRHHPHTVEEDSGFSADGEVLQVALHQRPHKFARSCGAEDNRLAVVKHLQRTPPTPKTPQAYLSPDSGRFLVREMESSPDDVRKMEEKENGKHSLCGQFPSVALFKQYQNAAMAATMGIALRILPPSSEEERKRIGKLIRSFWDCQLGYSLDAMLQKTIRS
ncbi:hypothetical protein ACLOJK_012870 [Asimina triloba]